MKPRTGLKKEYIDYALRILELKPSLFSNEKSLLVREIISVAMLFKELPEASKEPESLEAKE